MGLKAEDFWRALDVIARERGLTSSGLARQAGLDPTTFNPSKRGGLRGDGRWPSTSSLALVLEATGLSFIEFARLLEQPETHGLQARLESGKRRAARAP
jgi:phage repressor protein C with HTH and peptisase S24 domain